MMNILRWIFCKLGLHVGWTSWDKIITTDNFIIWVRYCYFCGKVDFKHHNFRYKKEIEKND